MRNPEFRADSLGAVGYGGNQAIEKEVRVRLVLPDGSIVARGTLDPWRPLVATLVRAR
jgi:hypothetical protein